MHAGSPDRWGGFTLIEMLIAIAIFGIMSAVSYRVLNTVLETRERVTEDYRRWRDVARAVASLERDFEAIRARPVRDGAHRLAAPLVGNQVILPSDDLAVAFSRAGDPLASGSAAAPCRVGYRVHEGALERVSWTGLDQGPRSAQSAQAILPGVASLELRYRDVSGEWRAAWPPPLTEGGTGASSTHVKRPAWVDTTLPAAVELTIQLANGPRIARLIPLAAGARR